MMQIARAIVGGILIGASAVALMGWNGRTAGISGIFFGAVLPEDGDRAWRIAFVAGLMSSGALASWTMTDAPLVRTYSLPVLLIGGALAGVGTAMGSGCTSGHGVCGLARGSVRSMAAVATFMAFAMATVYLRRHVWTLSP